jgi:energy-coupling factor transporter transmembrane protein EcfT
MGELTTIGFTPGQSVFHRLDPRTKQALLMGLSMMSLLGGMVFLLSFTAAMTASLYVSGIRLSRLIAEMRYFLVFLFFVFGIRSVTFADGWMPSISLDQAGASLVVCWRLLLVVSMGVLLMATTRTADIRAAMVWYLKARYPSWTKKWLARWWDWWFGFCR